MPKWARPATVDRIAGRPQVPGRGAADVGAERRNRCGVSGAAGRVGQGASRARGRMSGDGWLGGAGGACGAHRKNSAPPERVLVGRSREVRVIRVASRGGACCEETHAAGPMPRKIGGCRAAATVARVRRPAGQATRSRTPLRLSDSTTTVSPACRRPSMISSESGSSTWSASVRFRARAP